MAKDYDLWIAFALFQSSIEQPRFHVTKWPNRAKHLKLHLKKQRPALTPLHWTAFQTLTPLEKIGCASKHYVKTYSNARPDSAVCRLWYHEQLRAFVPTTNHIFKKIFSSTFSNGFSSSGTTWSHAEAHTNIPLGIRWATEAQRERGKEKKKRRVEKKEMMVFHQFTTFLTIRALTQVIRQLCPKLCAHTLPAQKRRSIPILCSGCATCLKINFTRPGGWAQRCYSCVPGPAQLGKRVAATTHSLPRGLSALSTGIFQARSYLSPLCLLVQSIFRLVSMLLTAYHL